MNVLLYSPHVVPYLYAVIFPKVSKKFYAAYSDQGCQALKSIIKLVHKNFLELVICGHYELLLVANS